MGILTEKIKDKSDTELTVEAYRTAIRGRIARDIVQWIIVGAVAMFAMYMTKNPWFFWILIIGLC